jgi:hypothetical protein
LRTGARVGCKIRGRREIRGAAQSGDRARAVPQEYVGQRFKILFDAAQRPGPALLQGGEVRAVESGREIFRPGRRHRQRHQRETEGV